MKNRTQIAQRVTWVGFWTNLLLTGGKLAAGVLGSSSAMVADAVHSLSDFATDIVVLAFVKVSGKEKDADHRYGHGKYETFATMIISITLLAVGIAICIGGIQKIIMSFRGEILGQPTLIAFAAAPVSVIIKEWLYRYTIKTGRSINNQAVIANAWHHRSDAFSSIGTMVGIGGAIFLGAGWRVLDPIAGVIVSFFIMKVAVELGLPSINELLESALPEEVENEILNIIHETPGVETSHRLQTRKIGNTYAIDIHIKLDPEISFIKSHDICSEIERNLRKQYGDHTQITIHPEPLHHKVPV